MNKLYNRRSDRAKRQLLRKNMTEAEIILWERLRRRQIDGHKFRRQYSIKGFVIDFYSPELRLGIEVDGGYHRSRVQSDYDNARQRLIESIEIKFIRVTNDEITDDVEQVISRIKYMINNSIYLPLNKGKMSRAPSLSRGRGTEGVK